MIRRKTLIAGGLSLLVGFTAACHGGNTVTGSIASDFDLSFDDVRAYWMAHELVIAYESTLVPRLDTSLGLYITSQAVRLVLDEGRQSLETAVEIPMVSPEGVPMASVDHYVIVQADDGSLAQAPNFPELKLGTLHFAALDKRHGRAVSGHFDCEFKDGRLLTGKFDVPLSDPP